DLGGTFIHPTQNLTVGLAFKNLGFVMSEYSEASETKVPFDIQVGVTFKPEHMPLRFSFTTYNLASAGGDYDNPDTEIDDLNSLDKIMSHIIIGAEILFHRNVNVLLAYNFLKGQELNTENSGGKGLSIGAAIDIKAVELVVSRSSFSVGNGAYSFTLNANIQKMIFKKRTI
ncbi:MAG TPA: hypothetical protein VFU05_17635, partial [Cyclobacteriaceae bacterium]|nr:hypothetical protein [Cyclobacteriaceae bacterium]